MEESFVEAQKAKILASFNTDEGSAELRKSEIIDIEKGRKVAFIGEKRVFGGRNYIKTKDGWKYYGKGTGQKRVASSTSIKAEDIFDDIKAINPNVSEISSMGSFTSEQSKQVAESVRAKVMKYLPDNSLASKILKTTNKLSDKQLWVVAHELQKNEDYVSDLSERNEKQKREVAYQKKKRSDKRRKRSEEANKVKKTLKETSDKNSKLSVGDKVKHIRIGAGTITEITSDKITIKFDDGDVKSFMPDFVKLEKI